MPVYNTNEEYFRKAIDSIINQTFTDLELLIVDDYSQAYIKDIVISYNDSRIKYFRLNKNQGAAHARNFAISKAVGKYLAFMDSDDISLPNRLEVQYNFLEQNPEIGCLGANTEVIDGVNKKINRKNSHHKPSKHKEIEEFLVFEGCIFCQSSVMLRKEILDKNNIFYKTEYVPAEDYAFWLDLIGYTKFEILEDILVKYRSHAENISNRQRSLQRQKGINVQFNAIEKYCGFRLKDKVLLSSFFSGEEFSADKVQNLYFTIKEIIAVMQAKEFSEKVIFSLFGKKFKKLYYYTRSLSGQWHLMRSPLNDLLNIPLSLRIFCLITRGIF
jgi:glycosyltransferase involved in cell wall biosynthesis